MSQKLPPRFGRVGAMLLLVCAVCGADRLDVGAATGYGIYGLGGSGRVLPRHPFVQDVGIVGTYYSRYGPVLGLGVMHVGPQSYTVLSPRIGLQYRAFAVEFWPKVIYATNWLIPVTGLLRIGREDRFHCAIQLRHGISQATQGRFVLGVAWPIGSRLRMEAGVDPNMIDIDAMGWDFYHGGVVLGVHYLMRDGLCLSGNVRNYSTDIVASVGLTWQIGERTWLVEGDHGVGND